MESNSEKFNIANAIMERIFSSQICHFNLGTTHSMICRMVILYHSKYNCISMHTFKFSSTTLVHIVKIDLIYFLIKCQ